MGDRDPVVGRTRSALREKEMAVIHAVMTCLFLLLLVQFPLLMVAVEAFLGGKSSVLVSAALGSGLCFAGACWLVRRGVPSRSGGAA